MAKRQPTRRRIAPDTQVASDDAFVAGVYEASTWAQRNSQALILGAVALILVIGGALYYASYRRDVNRQAVQEMEVVQQVYAYGLPEEAEIRLNGYLQRFGGSRHAMEARLLLAQLHLQQARPEQAISTLEGEARSGREPLQIQARMLLGRAYEAAGRPQDAERQYLGVAGDAAMDFQRREALTDAARLRASTGNHAGAAELYRRILDGLDATSLERGFYEMRLAESEHQARG